MNELWLLTTRNDSHKYYFGKKHTKKESYGMIQCIQLSKTGKTTL